MPSIFISHSPADELFAEAVRGVAARCGWHPGDIALDASPYGDAAAEWARQRQTSPDPESSALFVIASKDWLTSIAAEGALRAHAALAELGIEPIVLSLLPPEAARKLPSALSTEPPIALLRCGPQTSIDIGPKGEAGSHARHSGSISLPTPAAHAIAQRLHLDAGRLVLPGKPKAAEPPEKPRYAVPDPRWPDGQEGVIFRVASRMEGDAPLRAVVSHPAVRRAMETYEQKDAEAIKYQKAFKRLGWVALVLSTVATLSAAATLMPIEHWLPKFATRLVSGLQSIANVAAFLLILWLDRRGVADRWMASRAEAEADRGRIFETILAVQGPPGSDRRRLVREKQQLVEEAHLDYQLGYFTKAARRHKRLIRALTLPRVIALSATGVAISMGLLHFAGLDASIFPAFLQWLTDKDVVRWQLGLNTIASSLLAYASARAAMTQDERNAALFERSRKDLQELKDSELEATRWAAADGDEARVAAFLGKIKAILEADHRAWLLTRPPDNPTVAPARSP